MLWKTILTTVRASLSTALLAGLLLYAVWPWLPFNAQAALPRTVIFYGFSILDHAITDDVFPLFRRRWVRQTREDVELISSFAGSGTLTNQIIMGVPVDLTLLALEADADRLAEAGVVPAKSWRQLPYKGVVNRTPLVILVRPGNPKKIYGFEDLARPGVRVVHPDPLTSGAANWSIVAEYGAAARAHPEDPEAGYKALLGIWKNVVAQAASARAARTQFDLGFGDALVTYEQEGLWDRAHGKLRAEIVYPPSTILTEHTLVVIETNIDPHERALVDSLVAFLWTEDAQQAFVRNGFRSVNEKMVHSDSTFGVVADPFLIDSFGGWGKAKKEIVEAVWKQRVLKELDR